MASGFSAIRGDNKQVRSTSSGSIRFSSEFATTKILLPFSITGMEGVDALHILWPQALLYAFPPLPLMPAVVRKILREKAEVIFIAPYWPRRPWFADLVSLSRRHGGYLRTA